MGQHARQERARLMRRLGELIDQNVPMLAELETRDTGLPISQTRKQLIPRASENFNFFAEVCTRMNGHTYPVDDQMLNYTLYQPVGVCALVSPWNVPFMTATWKTAPCLALGNTAVLKMSELSPLTADQLGMLALEAGIPPGVLNVVQGYGADAGDALVRHRACAPSRSPAAPSPARRSWPAPAASRNTRWSWAASRRCWCSTTPTSSARWTRRCSPSSLNGERCTAGSRIFVQETIYDDFVRRFAERANRLVVGDPTDEHTHVGSMITRQHWEKVTGYIRLAEEEGARVLAGGPNCPPACRRGWLAAISCVPRCWPTWTTACAAPRKRSSARSPACCPSRTRSTA